MMKVLITGASGLIGRAVSHMLAATGHEVIPLRRGQHGSAPPYWNIDRGEVVLGAQEDIDIVIHLAGESIAEGRWNENKKRAIRESRVAGTSLLSSFFSESPHPPGLFISGSATGFYGNRGAEMLTEESPRGSGFLSEVCASWEEALLPLSARGIRTVALRFGIVLASGGGILKKMILPFKAGLGARIGSGQQYMSWVTLQDVVGIIRYSIEHTDLMGPVNVVTPNPVTNQEFTKTLGRVLARPSFLVLPAIMAKGIWGEMAQELLLSGARVIPQKILASGYVFKDPLIEPALRNIMEK